MTFKIATIVALTAYTNIVMPEATALAQGGPADFREQRSPSQKCPIVVQHNNGNAGVQVCAGEQGSASVGVSASQGEVEHFFKYPLGQSKQSVVRQLAEKPLGGDHSVPNDVGRAIAGVFGW